nr:protamine mP2 intermediate protein pmP2/16 [mice, Peptide Partial, 10 aa] [Mus sp.]
PGQDHEREEQ